LKLHVAGHEELSVFDLAPGSANGWNQELSIPQMLQWCKAKVRLHIVMESGSG
jgi:hypothetical protein